MPGPIGILDQLTPDQQATLLAWIDEGPTMQAVVQKVAAPPPDGFGIQTHVTSLRRFHARQQLKERVADLDLARELAQGQGTGPTFLAAAETMLAEKAFQFLTEPNFRAGNFAAVSRWFLKVREQELRREELLLERERLAVLQKKARFSAALREASAETEYQEAKIAEARREVFGAD